MSEMKVDPKTEDISIKQMQGAQNVSPAVKVEQPTNTIFGRLLGFRANSSQESSEIIASPHAFPNMSDEDIKASMAELKEQTSVLQTEITQAQSEHDSAVAFKEQNQALTIEKQKEIDVLRDSEANLKQSLASESDSTIASCNDKIAQAESDLAEAQSMPTTKQDANGNEVQDNELVAKRDKAIAAAEQMKSMAQAQKDQRKNAIQQELTLIQNRRKEAIDANLRANESIATANEKIEEQTKILKFKIYKMSQSQNKIKLYEKALNERMTAKTAEEPKVS